MLLLMRPVVFVAIISIVLVMSSKSEGAESKSQTDLPRENDLQLYLGVLDKLISFSEEYKHEIDLNNMCGIFLGNVILKSTLMFQKFKLPEILIDKLNEITKRSEELIVFFKKMADADTKTDKKKSHKLLSLISNETEWAIRFWNLDSLIQKPLRIEKTKQIEIKFHSWTTYAKNVKYYEQWTPRPDESDTCLVSLSENHSRKLNKLGKCTITDKCYDILVHGSGFGYALTHRMLLLLLARYGRGCVLVSPYLDQELMHRLCSTAYSEAKYIASHGFQQVDLMAEEMAVCSAAGSNQFLSRAWLANLIGLQSDSGCFYNKNLRIVPKNDTDTKNATKPRHNFLFLHDEYPTRSEGCVKHMNGLASAVFANAITYILNEYYLDQQV